MEKKQGIDALTVDEARKIYTDEIVLKYASDFVLNRDVDKGSPDFKKLEIVKYFPYRTAESLIDLMVVRFRDQRDKKHVLTYWYNGKNVVMKGYPVLIYGRNLLAKYPDKPFIFHEGEKPTDVANESLTDFVHLSWNGGGKKWKKIQGLEVLKGREGFLLPDDDQMRSKATKEIMSPGDQPGIITMSGLGKRLKKEVGVDAFNLGVFPEARAIKESGADIEEILQVFSPEIITEQISKAKEKHDSIFVNTTTSQKTAKAILKNKENKDGRERSERNIKNGGETNHKIHNSSVLHGSDSRDGDSTYPFKILGIADDGMAYFLDYTGRMVCCRTTQINENFLLDTFGLDHFTKKYGKYPSKTEWGEEVDVTRQFSKLIDFDPDSCKGRGTWKDDQDRICYHDGKNTIGDFDTDETFLRKRVKNIGLKSKDCPFGIRKEIMELSKKFSFSTSSDAVRLLSHAAVSPFGGALNWRTAILVTGSSGSGKSTVVDNVCKPIASPIMPWGGETSEAAIRQYSANDSTPEYIDEMDGDNKKDRDRIDSIFTLMRSSTTDNSPVTGKGSISGKVSIFRMKSMFCFVAVNDAIANSANDNRIVRINFKKQENFKQFVEDLQEVKKLLTKENCNGIRAFTWRNLKKIIALGERLELIIQIVTKQDARFAAGESILLATNLIVWENQVQELSDEDLTSYVKEFYKNQTQEAKRDEVEEMINRLLDETVLFGRDRDRLSMRFILVKMKRFLDWKFERGESLSTLTTDARIIDYGTYKEYKKTVEQFGLSAHVKTRELAIAQNHHEVMRILNIAKGYQRQLERHKNLRLEKQAITIDSGTKICTVLGGFLEYEIDGE